MRGVDGYARLHPAFCVRYRTLLRQRSFDDVIQIELSTRRSRAVGYGVAAYLVRGVLVDTGFPRIARRITRFLDETPLRGALITHHHEDHAGNVELLASRGVPLGMGALTRERLVRPAPIELYRRMLWGTPHAVGSPIEPFGDVSLALVAAPGHTRDHHVVWDAERETIFSGDLYLGVKVRIAHRSERPRETLRSLRRAIALAPKRLFCAHRGFVPAPAAALAAKAEWMAETIGRVDARIAAGWSDGAILDDVLGGESATGRFTRGAYARINFVRSVRGEPTAVGASGQPPSTS